eukprot:TRINITY_DN29641_c0_g1_i1.p3 TRINITY_DN29641_c0_g1~~TRINITY_DN29641_c0_g1_i1.p3  ORF type:complete len:136 (+),score=14.13 TRINITY_DN29641_c0_g1_i1:302-709(+)
METGWHGATVAAFSRKAMRDVLILGMYAGILLSLIIHGVVNWISLRQIQFGFFVGYALCILLFGLTINGFTRIAGLGVPPGLWFAGCFLFIMGSVACFLPLKRPPEEFIPIIYWDRSASLAISNSGVSGAVSGLR